MIPIIFFNLQSSLPSYRSITFYFKTILQKKMLPKAEEKVGEGSLIYRRSYTILEGN